MRTTTKARVEALERGYRARGGQPPITRIEVCVVDAAGTVTLIETIELNNGRHQAQN